MNFRLLFLCFLVLTTSPLVAQHPLSKIKKSKHLSMLSEGVLLVRLSNQDKKIEELTKRGQVNLVAQIKEEQNTQNKQITKAFQTHFNYCKVHFIAPDDTKSIITNKSKPIFDLATGKEIDLTIYKDVYVTDYNYGHPAEGNERYNRKGFQLRYIEDGIIVDIGRDLFYAGVKQGFLAPAFEKSLQKTIYKLNRRLQDGSRYL